MSVCDRLAPAGEVRLHAQGSPARVAGEPESGAHLIENQYGTALIAGGAHAPGECRLDGRLVPERVMAIRHHDDRREVVARGVQGGLEAREIVVVAGELMGPVLRNRA